MSETETETKPEPVADNDKTEIARTLPPATDKTEVAQTLPPTTTRRRLSEFLPERLVRRVLDNVGSAVDKKLGRVEEASTGLTTPKLIANLKDQIDRRVRDEGRKGRVAPHLIKLKVEWGKHDNAPGGSLKNLEHELMAAAIDHINDHRYRTLAPLKVEIESDVFTKSISVLATFGDFEEELQQRDAGRQPENSDAPDLLTGAAPAVVRDLALVARISRPGIESHEVNLSLEPGGRRLSIGRGADNALRITHSSVSKVHAALVLKTDGTILIADTGSTNGTFLNGRRLSYGEARSLEEGDVITFGEVEVRLRRA